MIFTRDETALIRQGKITGAVIPASEPITAGRLRNLRRRYVRHDEDGNAIGEATATVTDTNADGERRPVVLTILSIVEQDLAEPIHLDIARACGYRSAAELREEFSARYPRTTRVKLVRFLVGDTRDRDRYLNWTGRAGGDYTLNPRRAMDDAPALTEEQQARMTAEAHKRDELVRQHRRSKTPLAERLHELERLAAQGDDRAKRALFSIEQRVERVAKGTSREAS